MNMMKIYDKLPIPMQHLACCVEGKRIQRSRYNADFYKIFDEYKQRNNWSYEQMCEFRDKRLRKIFKHCYDTVPYYQNLFNDYGINPETVRTIDDLHVIPILTKEAVKENIKDLVSNSFDRKKMIKKSTSGTTGSGLTFYSTSQTVHEQWAAFWRARNNIGIEIGEWNAIFGGRKVVPLEQSNPPFWRFNILGKQIYFSVYHINEKNIDNYISEIENRNIKWIHSYPSAISLIAQYMVENNLRLKNSVEFITTGSENLMESQKSLIYEAFGVVPYQHYGQSENVAIFSENRNHRIFVDEDFSAVEFMYDSNLQTYKVVGTSLNNYAMPLIRYEIGDIANFRESSEGREIISIDGRKDDYIILTNGSKIGRLAHILNGVSNISESQIVQKKVGEITVKIVKSSCYSNKDETQLIKNLHDRIGYSEKINIEYVNEIPKTKNGKLRFVVSEVEK